MKRNPFVIPFILVSLFIVFASVMPTYASTDDYALVKSYCKANYPNHKVVMFTKYNVKVMEHRANKKVVYVEKFVSYSKGKYGYSKKGEYVKYNKRVKKGKKVISYFVYNPYTNYCDDVVAVVDNHRIR
jgi:hypothetical protein